MAIIEDVVERGDGPRCDFCSVELPSNDDSVMKKYPCRDFTRRSIMRGKTMIMRSCLCHTPDVPIQPGDKVHDEVMQGFWGACGACAACIDRDDRIGLAQVGVNAFDEVFGSGPHPDINFVIAAHAPFFFHRITEQTHE